MENPLANMFGTLGSFGSLAPEDPYQKLLGEYYDPRAAKWNTAGSLLSGLGTGLMTRDWAKAAEVSRQGMAGYRDNAMKRYAAAQMMQAADEKKQERARAEEERKMRESYISQLTPDQQMKARSIPGYLEKLVGATDPALQDAQASGSSVYGNVYFDEDGNPYALGKDGQFVKPGGLAPGAKLLDPEAIAAAKARGGMIGGAPNVVIEDYTKNIRPQMSNLADTVTMLGQAKTYLSKGIQTGSQADKIQALRSLGAQLGFNVDEQVLANTQTYQNFIGNVVIPRMKELGGNDSNEELARLYSLSGGDINQSLPALVNTLDFMERLQTRKFKRLKASEDVALKYIPDLSPIELGGIDAPASSGTPDMPDLSQMTEEQLRAIADGKQ